MSDMKCPFCNKPLHCGATLKSDEYLVDLYQCANPECESTEFLVGCREFWDILGQHIRTRKALNVAVDALKIIGSGEVIEHSVMFHEDDNKIFIANKALEQITALEQKE